MHLQSLELFGFKSFADKTILNFHEGITAIVGPNGCGKSNVLDAMRWVLGEQSAKSLRGAEMADVIFNGSDTRKPLGFGEVSLALTDCAAELGVDWHDVRVTRRIHRDGNSEYFLNKTPCRLRDIQSLFADTGVGRSAYSMMEQGKIDLILSSRPEDRRTVFEEAAGITKYKSQKREALRKLEATEANLLRISDIIKEVKRQIGSLQRQAGKARRYQVLMADLQVLDTHQSRKHLGTLEADLEGARTDIVQITETERATRDKIDDRETALADERRRVDEIDAEISEVRGEVERLQSEIGTRRNRIEFNRQRAEEITELIGRSRGEIAAAEGKRAQQQLQMQELNALAEKTAAVISERQSELNRLSETVARARADRSSREEELKSLQLFAAKSESRIATMADDLAGTLTRRQATAEHLKNLDAEMAAAHKALDQANDTLTSARSATDSEREKVERLLTEAAAAENSLEQLRQALEQAELSLVTIDRTLAENESRLEILRQLNEEGEGLSEGSQGLLRGSDELREFHPAVAGSLVAQLDVDPRFVTAIEAALGRTLHAIVLHNGDLAGEILQRLSRRKLGQAALFIPEFFAGNTAPESAVLPDGALGWAVDKAVAPEGLELLVRQLLKGVAIFADLGHAFRCKKGEPALAIATLAGEFISADGIVFGGSSSVHKESLLERKGRISVLANECSALARQRAELQKKRDDAKAHLESATARTTDLRSQHRMAELAQSAAATRIAILERELDIATGRLDDLRNEQSTLSQQIGAADERLSALEEELLAARAAFAAEEERRSGAETSRTQAIADEGRAVEQLNEIRLALASEQQRYDNLLAQREPMTAREAELEETIQARRADIVNFERRLLAQGEESQSAESAIHEQSVRQQERKAALSSLTTKRTDSAGTLNAAEASLREIRDSLNGLHERRAAQQVRESQLQMKIDNLVDHVQRRYHLDLRAFAADHFAFGKTLHAQLKRREKGESTAPSAPDALETAGAALGDVTPAQIDQVIADLTQQLESMGPVNLDAVQEYDELEERYKFLETQNNDLTTARRELLDVIARINATTQTLFAETFAQVRTNFREMFSELFGGGRADLALMDENDPLNCGIEISAKPPGKQQQSVSLLSGGERTMTAVALLFAIYMVRPSPFCVLDEMDAALDETNINRFIRVLDRFVAQSQFIIITHNKRTIAKADVLYGVTMEERGISKLVGMKMAERPENYADPSPGASGHGNGNGVQRHLKLEAAAREPALIGTN
jgi:chromosome segregation protein